METQSENTELQNWSDKQVRDATKLYEYLRFAEYRPGGSNTQIVIEWGKKAHLGKDEEAIRRNVAAVMKKAHNWARAGIMKDITTVLNYGGGHYGLDTILIRSLAAMAGLEIKITGDEKIDRENIRKFVAENSEENSTNLNEKKFAPDQIEAAKSVNSYFKCAQFSSDKLMRKYNNMAGITLGKGMRLGKDEEEIRKNVTEILEQEPYTATQVGFAKVVDNILDDGGKINIKTIQALAIMAGLEIEITGNGEADRKKIQKLVENILGKPEKLECQKSAQKII